MERAECNRPKRRFLNRNKGWEWCAKKRALSWAGPSPKPTALVSQSEAVQDDFLFRMTLLTLALSSLKNCAPALFPFAMALPGWSRGHGGWVRTFVCTRSESSGWVGPPDPPPQTPVPVPYPPGLASLPGLAQWGSWPGYRWRLRGFGPAKSTIAVTLVLFSGIWPVLAGSFSSGSGVEFVQPEQRVFIGSAAVQAMRVRGCAPCCSFVRVVRAAMVQLTLGAFLSRQRARAAASAAAPARAVAAAAAAGSDPWQQCGTATNSYFVASFALAAPVAPRFSSTSC
eukprot:gene22579-biopygen16262